VSGSDLSAPQRFYVETLGCPKNQVDSDKLIGSLLSQGMTPSESAEAADLVVVNTCAFIEEARAESIEVILALDAQRAEGSRLVVTGCMAQRYGSELAEALPEVDQVAGFGVPLTGKRQLIPVSASQAPLPALDLLNMARPASTAPWAYVKIAEGCDRPCAFCAIPLMRGGHKSTPIEDLVNNTKKLVAGGTKEIMLIAQDLTYYGLDLYKKRNLSELLKHLSDVEGLDWIRLHYAYPSNFPMDVLDVMNERSNVCNYLDMPLQHISDSMLKSMRRQISRKKTEDLVAAIRDKVPGIALRTTLISGFPGESDSDFQELADWVQATRFDRLGIFPYSHEENTHAYTKDDNVPHEVKEQRAQYIMEIQSEISYQLNQEKVGKTFKVLVDKAEGEYFIGRTEFDSPDVDNEVLIPKAEGYARIGDFVNVKINQADFYDLYGSIVNETC
jgi:ribosomal protein S12 methylthiotransferase